jgi:hypothetical protein
MVTAAGPVLTAAAPGFSRALAGTGPVFLAFLAVHVLAGLTAVISGALAATAPKRRGRHTRAGTVYYRAITALFATWPWGVAQRRRSPSWTPPETGGLDPVSRADAGLMRTPGPLCRTLPACSYVRR